MLNDFYSDIINWLFKWNMIISINEQNTKAMFLPSDLFQFTINLNNESILQEFIEFIRMRHQQKGHYFNSHYMHEQLRIFSLFIQPDLIQKITPDLDILNSIKIIDKKNWTSTESDWNSCSIVDKFMIIDFDDFIVDEKHFILPQYFIDASKLFESETHWNPFYKLFSLFLTYNSYSEAMSILEDIGNIGMKICFVNISASNKEELEDLTNPKYFNKGLSGLEIYLNDTIMLTDTFFDNINQIEFKTISLGFAYGVTGSFDIIIRILKNVPQSVELNLKHKSALNSCFLCFTNVPIKIVQSNCEDSLFVNWNAFTCYVEIDQFHKDFWFSSIDSETTKNTSDTFIHLKYSKEYNFDCSKLIDESEIMKIYKTKFPNHNLMSECEFIIPMKYLYSVDYSKSIFSLIYNKDKLEFINEISKAQSIECAVGYYSGLPYLSEWTSLFPPKCRYSIYEYSKPNSCDEFETFIIIY